MTNSAAVERADAVVRDVVGAFLAQKDLAVVTRAPAGAGKSSLVRTAVTEAVKAGMKVLVTAPTNAQVIDLVERIALQAPKADVVFFPASTVTLPEGVAALPNVRVAKKAGEANEGQILLATLDKLAYAHDDLLRRDALVVDEAYQADSAKYFCVSGLAEHHLLVGDSGQLSPFTTVDPGLWRGLPEDPLQTAVGVLLRNHPTTKVFPLPITRRLPPSAAKVAGAFYPGLAFEAATLADERSLKLSASTSADARTRAVDAALEEAAGTGWAHVVLPEAPVLVTDPEAVDVIADLLGRFFERSPKAKCEKHPKGRTLTPADVAIGVSHNLQKDMLRTALKRRDLEGVQVDTANRLQGLEFQLLVAWHPLAGLADVDDFHLDPGRLCVLLTRHRHACLVVGRASDARLIEGLAPAAPAFLGHEEEPTLDGWEAHVSVFEHLARHHIDVPGTGKARRKSSARS